jgi:hypothetical protein
MPLPHRDFPFLTKEELLDFIKPLEDFPKNEACPICKELYGGEDHKPVVMLCSHVFGQRCIVDWLEQSHTCPMCRSKLYGLPDSPFHPVYYEYMWETDVLMRELSEDTADFEDLAAWCRTRLWELGHIRTLYAETLRARETLESMSRRFQLTTQAEADLLEEFCNFSTLPKEETERRIEVWEGMGEMVLEYEGIKQYRWTIEARLQNVKSTVLRLARAGSVSLIESI